MTMSHKIKVKRRLAGLTQTELSKKTGINRSTISKIENQKQSISIFQLQIIASALDVDISEFLTLENENV